MNFDQLQQLLGPAWPVVYTLLKIVAIVLPLMLGVAYLTLWERKLIGWMQVRIGPNRVGPLGLLQPIADGVKLLLKEIIVPTGANKFLFVLAPVMRAASHQPRSSRWWAAGRRRCSARARSCRHRARR